MNRNDQIVSLIRTGVPALVGLILAKLIAAVPAVQDGITWVDDNLGSVLGIPVATLLTTAATAGVITGYYWAARKLGQKWPALEAWLLGSSKTPTYQPKHSA